MCVKGEGVREGMWKSGGMRDEEWGEWEGKGGELGVRVRVRVRERERERERISNQLASLSAII